MPVHHPREGGDPGNMGRPLQSAPSVIRSHEPAPFRVDDEAGECQPQRNCSRPSRTIEHHQLHGGDAERHLPILCQRARRSGRGRQSTEHDIRLEPAAIQSILEFRRHVSLWQLPKQLPGRWRTGHGAGQRFRGGLCERDGVLWRHPQRPAERGARIIHGIHGASQLPDYTIRFIVWRWQLPNRSL